MWVLLCLRVYCKLHSICWLPQTDVEDFLWKPCPLGKQNSFEYNQYVVVSILLETVWTEMYQRWHYLISYLSKLAGLLEVAVILFHRNLMHELQVYLLCLDAKVQALEQLILPWIDQ